MTDSIAKIGGDAIDPKVIEAMVTRGDLSGLGPQQKAQHYIHVCERLKLDPATQPFEYMRLQGKEIMYARKGCADQLRQVHKISIEIVGRETVDGLYIVTARGRTPEGRVDEDIGAVTIGNSVGDNLANAMMKAHTKAKRRVTLSICGLGMPDESELETIESSFSAIPQESPRPVASTVRELRPAGVERPTQRAAEALPETFSASMPIPASILMAIKPLQDVADIAVEKMDSEELELVIEHMDRCHQAWKPRKDVSARALRILEEIAASAQQVLERRNQGDAS